MIDKIAKMFHNRLYCVIITFESRYNEFGGQITFTTYARNESRAIEKAFHYFCDARVNLIGNYTFDVERV